MGLGGGGPVGAAAPHHGPGGGANVSICPPSKNCVETVKNSITPNIPTAGINRASEKNRGHSTPKGGPADSGALANRFAIPQIGLPP